MKHNNIDGTINNSFCVKYFKWQTFQIIEQFLLSLSFGFKHDYTFKHYLRKTGQQYQHALWEKQQ